MTGIWDFVTKPEETVQGVIQTAIHPVETFNYIKKAIADSFERDLVNGDAYSRAHWVSYAVATVFGGKGAGTVAKTGINTTKAAVQKGAATAKDAIKKVDITKYLPYAPQHQLATPEGIPYNVVNSEGLKEKLISMARVEMKGIDNPKVRLPRTNGKWFSEKPEVNNITNGEGVEFKSGRPNFTSWSEGDLVFEKGKLSGTSKDFSLVYEEIQKQYNLPSKNAAKKLLKQAGVTPHHKSDTVIELIPTDLHKNVPHIGSASDLRGGF